MSSSKTILSVLTAVNHPKLQTIPLSQGASSSLKEWLTLTFLSILLLVAGHVTVPAQREKTEASAMFRVGGGGYESLQPIRINHDGVAVKHLLPMWEISVRGCHASA